MSPRLILAAALAALAVGCGESPTPPGPPVRGKVVYKDSKSDTRRLEGGRVEFRSVANPKQVAVGTITEGGEFTLGTPAEGYDGPPGVPAGEYQARVLPPRADRDTAEAGAVHPKYQDFNTAKLKFTVPVPDDFTIILDTPLKNR